MAFGSIGASLGLSALRGRSKQKSRGGGNIGGISGGVSRSVSNAPVSPNARNFAGSFSSPRSTNFNLGSAISSLLGGGSRGFGRKRTIF